MKEEHPIQFIRQEILDFWERIQKHGNDSSRLQTDVDLACENIIEHFNLTQQEDI